MLCKNKKGSVILLFFASICRTLNKTYVKDVLKTEHLVQFILPSATPPPPADTMISKPSQKTPGQFVGRD